MSYLQGPGLPRSSRKEYLTLSVQLEVSFGKYAPHCNDANVIIPLLRLTRALFSTAMKHIGAFNTGMVIPPIEP